MTVSNLELHGIDTPLDEEIVLRAGRFEAIFEPARAYLRRVRIDGVESVRIAYLHVRGPDWETVLPTVTNLETRIGSDHFVLTWTARHVLGDIDFEWKGTLTGTPDGITYECDGTALREFKTNRTGMCVLIPREFRSTTVDLEHPDGATDKVLLPTTIAPAEPLRQFRAVLFGQVKLTFQGDDFEAEDQRNWSDASFKCYSLRGRRKPAYALLTGEKVVHSVRIEPTQRPGTMVNKISDVLADDRVSDRPNIGAALDNDHDDFGNLNVSFLRVVLPRDPAAAAQVLDHARGSGMPLLVVAPRGLRAPELRQNETLIFEDARDRSTAAKTEWLGAGAFDAFNMGRHEAAGFNGVEVTVTPQVHTFDERSILENAATLVDLLASLRAIAPTADLGLNVRFKGDGADPRQESLFGALWVLRCYAAAAEFGSGHITLGSVSEMRHPATAALCAELSDKQHYILLPVAATAEIVAARTMNLVQPGRFVIGNLLRKPRPLKVSGSVASAERLTPSGWKQFQFQSGYNLTPYEIVLLQAKGPSLTIE